MGKLKQLLSNMRSSFWFVPSLVVAGSIAIALALIEADSAWGDYWLAQWPPLFGIGPEGARQMLSTLAGSMTSVMGVTCSMTSRRFWHGWPLDSFLHRAATRKDYCV